MVITRVALKTIPAIEKMKKVYPATAAAFIETGSALGAVCGCFMGGFIGAVCADKTLRDRVNYPLALRGFAGISTVLCCAEIGGVCGGVAGAVAGAVAGPTVGPAMSILMPMASITVGGMYFHDRMFKKEVERV